MTQGEYNNESGDLQSKKICAYDGETYKGEPLWTDETKVTDEDVSTGTTDNEFYINEETGELVISDYLGMGEHHYAVFGGSNVTEVSPTDTNSQPVTTTPPDTSEAIQPTETLGTTKVVKN